MSIFKNQRGDTILEVLISVAVLSLVLSSTFALANKNSQANRQAAERGEAQKIAQSEMEKLKVYLATGGSVEPGPGDYFCMNDTATGIFRFTSPDRPPDVASDDLSFANSGFPNQCTPQGAGLYYHYIVRDSAVAQKDTYTSFVRWNAATGHGVDQVALVNKVHLDLTVINQSWSLVATMRSMKVYGYENS